VEPPKSVDLTNVSYDEFVAFLFDHDVGHGVPPESEKYDPWYFHVEVEFDAKNIANYYVRMFRQPEFLLTRFTKAQLEEGFWAIQGPNLNCSVSRILEGSDLTLSVREECIRSMADLFKRLFATEPFRYFGSDVGTHCATTGIVGIESESGAVRIWNCRMYFLRH
jgi:hypothetical protein